MVRFILICAVYMYYISCTYMKGGGIMCLSDLPDMYTQAQSHRLEGIGVLMWLYCMLNFRFGQIRKVYCSDIHLLTINSKFLPILLIYLLIILTTLRISLAKCIAGCCSFYHFYFITEYQICSRHSNIRY